MTRPASPSLLTRAEAAYEWLRQHADVVEGESNFWLRVCVGECGDLDGIHVEGTFGGHEVGFQTDTLQAGELFSSVTRRVVHMLETAVAKVKRNEWVA